METVALKTFYASFHPVQSTNMNPFFLSILIGSILGGINYLYWRSKGYKNSLQLVMSILGFTALTATLIRVLN
jgi:hypothetical protein